MDRVKSFLVPFFVCLCLLGIGIVVDSEVQDRTGDTLVSHVLPSNEEAPLVAAVEPVEEEIPIDDLDQYDTWQSGHLSLFLHDDWRQRPDEVRLVAAFSADPRLQKLTGKGPWEGRKLVHDHIYTPSNPMYQHRYSQGQGRIRQLPAIRLQLNSGRTIYQVGNTIPVPDTPCQLGNDIALAIKERFCPFPRPRPTPEPNPTPNPQPTPIPDMPIPDISPDQPDGEVIDEEKDDGTMSDQQLIGIGLLAGLCALIGTYIVNMKRNIRSA